MKEQTSPRILVVDDDESVRKTTTRMILRMGYPRDAVSSGEEALEKLQRERFDIVVSDIAMEGMNGLEFMEKAKERSPQLDFIIMTGYTSEYSYTDIVKAGAIDYLAKPFERAELQARLERVIKERHLLRQLKESEKRYSALVESSPDIIYTLDPEGKFSFIGGAMEKLLGFSSEELVGKHFTSVVYPEDIEKAHWHLNEQKTREQPSKRFELRLKTKEGETKSFEVYCMVMDLSTLGNCNQPINLKDETFLGAHAVARDVTQRKWAEEALLESHDELERTLSELKETQKYISNIFQAAGDAIRVIDKDFNILRANIEMDRLAGMPIGESVGKKCYEILRGESCDTDKCALRQVLAGGKYRKDSLWR
ncbi:MAG: PAS domain S-box protein [Deltaproteobacteria bacterium]|nr:PAS domain S-box protein [Deltaproteobacteria bacterium]